MAERSAGLHEPTAIEVDNASSTPTPVLKPGRATPDLRHMISRNIVVGFWSLIGSIFAACVVLLLRPVL